MQESKLWKAQRGQIHTLTWRWTCYGGEDSVDGSRDQWQKVTGDDGGDPEIKGATVLAGTDDEWFGGISKISTYDIYT